MEKQGESELPPKRKEDLDWKTLLFRSLLVLAIFFCIFIGFYWLAKDWIRDLSNWVSRHFGLPGIFVAVFVVDFLLTPATPTIFFPFVLDWEPVSLIATMSLASIVAGSAGYFVGGKLDRFPRIKKMTAFLERHGKALTQKYGVWAVAVGAMVPLPFSLVSWTAGLAKVRYQHLILGSLFRIPRFIIYYLVIHAGAGLLSF